MEHVSERFLRYVRCNTQSDHGSETNPSTARQLEFAKKLAGECSAMGLSDVRADGHGYVYAKLPGNADKAVTAIGFIAHMDTSEDFSGANVNPRIIHDYDCSDIELGAGLTLSPGEFPNLLRAKGKDIIVTDGTTLLGADDKAGIAEIMAAAEYLREHPEIKHGDIMLAFTPDEEIGRGAKRFDVPGFGAEFAFTVDGSAPGGIEYESFNAAKAVITIIGKSVHPGTAKGIMVNSLLLAQELIAELPANESPATTEGLEGYFHLVEMSGNCEKTVLEITVRDHDTAGFNRRKDFLIELCAGLNKKYEGRFILNLYDEYFNMTTAFEGKPHIVELARRAMRDIGLEPVSIAIRGGTDGSALSFMGLPCPNLFTGSYNHHGPYEYAAIQDMELSVKLTVRIAELHAN